MSCPDIYGILCDAGIQLFSLYDAPLENQVHFQTEYCFKFISEVCDFPADRFTEINHDVDIARFCLFPPGIGPNDAELRYVIFFLDWEKSGLEGCNYPLQFFSIFCGVGGVGGVGGGVHMCLPVMSLWSVCIFQDLSITMSSENPFCMRSRCV